MLSEEMFNHDMAIAHPMSFQGPRELHFTDSYRKPTIMGQCQMFKNDTGSLV
jgi:hypothetical protein